MSSPARPSAPDPRARKERLRPGLAGAAALLALVLLAPSRAAADCQGTTNAAAAACAGGRECAGALDAAWSACQQEHRRRGRPFPSEAHGHNNAAVLLAMRNERGLATYPELKASGDGEAPATYWQRERRPHETYAWSEFRSRRVPLDQLDAWLRAHPAYRKLAGEPPPQPSPDIEAKLFQAWQKKRGEPPTTPLPDKDTDSRLDEKLDSELERRGSRPAATPNGFVPDSTPAGYTPPARPPVDRRDAAAGRMLGGDNRGAIAAMDEALAEDPRDAAALGMRARARLLAGERDGAFADARLALRLDPRNQDARQVLGGADALAGSEGKLGRMKVRLDAMDEDAGGGGSRGRDQAGWEPAAAAPPAAYAAGGERAVQLRELWRGAKRFESVADWANALRESSRLIALDPENPDAWLLRAGVSAKMGQWASVEADARRALALKPDDPAALVMLGRSLVEQGKLVDGLAVLERAVALAPRNALAHYHRGEALERLGRKPEAVESYKLAASLDAGLAPLVEEALARLQGAGAVPAPRAPAGRQRAFRLLVAALGSLLLLKGLHFLVAQRARTGFSTTTRPPMRAEDAGALDRDPIAGDVIGGNFRVERELARGGMGVVYLATDVTLRRPVAIKRLHRDSMRDEETRRKFLQEAQLAARLKHPNLAQIHSVFGEERLNLVFELVEGRTLEAVLAERGRLTLRETREIVRQVCRALEHAHGQRVIHRDLKPGNLMLTTAGVCKVMDFGIAHQARTGSAPTMTQAWGTPPYMAPEQEEGYVSPASDLYALGVVAYELLAGRRPFDGPSAFAAKRAASFRRFNGEGGLPAELDRFFERALHPDVARRFSGAAEFRAAFDALAGTPPAPARPA